MGVSARALESGVVDFDRSRKYLLYEGLLAACLTHHSHGRQSLRRQRIPVSGIGDRSKRAYRLVCFGRKNCGFHSKE